MDNNLRKFQHLALAKYFSVFGLRLWPNVKMQLRSFTAMYTKYVCCMMQVSSCNNAAAVQTALIVSSLLRTCLNLFQKI
jgi:hypothetical protein